MQTDRWRATSALAVAVAGVAIVVLLAALVGSGLADAVDRPIIGAVRDDALVASLRSLAWITELGSTGAVTLVAIATVLIGGLIGSWRMGIAAAATIALASLGNSLLKFTFHRARPDLLDPIVVERGYSFPSGHAALSMVAYGVIVVLISRSALPPRLRFVAALGLGALVGLIGASRVWLGVHYPTDVLAGWSAGAVVVVAYAGLTRGVWPGPAARPAGAGQGTPRSDPPAGE